MVQIKSEAGRRLNAALDAQVGQIEDGQGRKIYGHKRISDARRNYVLAALRGDTERTTPKAQKSAVAIAVERRFITTLPSAAQAGRMGRAACIAVAIVGVVAAFAVDGTIFGLVASLPAPKLISAAFGSAG